MDQSSYKTWNDQDTAEQNTNSDKNFGAWLVSLIEFSINLNKPTLLTSLYCGTFEILPGALINPAPQSF